MGLFNRGAITPARTVNLVKDPTGAPAVNLTKVRDAGHVDLAKRADKAGLALSKRGLAGIRAQALLVLDHSGSMRADYASGAVQTLVERALGFALARYPVFVKFLAVAPVAYLNELDDLGNDRRLLDNVDAKPSSPALNLRTCTDAQFADAMVDEWDTWIAAATKAGVLR
jgi:hypothetical protein